MQWSGVEYVNKGSSEMTILYSTKAEARREARARKKEGWKVYGHPHKVICMNNAEEVERWAVDYWKNNG